MLKIYDFSTASSSVRLAASVAVAVDVVTGNIIPVEEELSGINRSNYYIIIMYSYTSRGGSEPGTTLLGTSPCDSILVVVVNQ